VPSPRESRLSQRGTENSPASLERRSRTIDLAAFDLKSVADRGKRMELPLGSSLQESWTLFGNFPLLCPCHLNPQLDLSARSKLSSRRGRTGFSGGLLHLETGLELQCRRHQAVPLDGKATVHNTSALSRVTYPSSFE